MDKILIGTITKPQALKGEFRIKPSLFNLKAYKTIENVFIKNKEYKVEKVTLRDTFVIMKVEGVNTCEMAEALRNTPIFAELENEGNDQKSIFDFDVILDGALIGKVKEINNYGATDVLSIKGDKNMMVPYIAGLGIENFEERTFTLNKEIFEQVVVYEN